MSIWQGCINILRVSCMVASSDDIDVSAVVCLGYPLKVSILPLSSWSAHCFLVPLYLNIIFYWVLLNWCPDKKWIYITFVAWLGQMMVAVSSKCLLSHPLCCSFMNWRFVTSGYQYGHSWRWDYKFPFVPLWTCLFSAPNCSGNLTSRCLQSLTPITRNLYWSPLYYNLRYQFYFHLIVLYST
jgi:hypothetical protein